MTITEHSVRSPSRQCDGKTKYTKFEAEQRSREYLWERSVITSAYPCPWCGKWHVGRFSKRGQNHD